MLAGNWLLMLNVGYQMLDAECLLLYTGCWVCILFIQCWILDAECSMLNAN